MWHREEIKTQFPMHVSRYLWQFITNVQLLALLIGHVVLWRLIRTFHKGGGICKHPSYTIYCFLLAFLRRVGDAWLREES